jgi:hypothetical protein
MWHVILFNLVLVTVCAHALLRGGAPERIAAIVYPVASLLTVVAAPAWRWPTDGVNWGVLAVDSALLAALVALALHANRFWPIWASAFQGFALLGHVSVVAAPSIAPVVYATMLAIAGYPMLGLLAIGAIHHARLQRAGAFHPDWTNFRSRFGP